jgi:alcohol dehydrogenase class IV
MNEDIAMTEDDFRALTDSRAHVMRALAAARASRPMDTVAMQALDIVRQQLTSSLRTLDALKMRAKVAQ